MAVPAQPTVSTAPVYRSVRLTGSAFSDPDAHTHAATRWIVRTSAGATAYDSGWQSDELTALVVRGLDPGAAYQASVQYRDSNNEDSAQSAWVDFTTLTGSLVKRQTKGLLLKKALGQTLVPGESVEVATAAEVPAEFVFEVDATTIASAATSFGVEYGPAYFNIFPRTGQDAGFGAANISGTIFRRYDWNVGGTASAETSAENLQAKGHDPLPQRVEIRNGQGLRGWTAEKTAKQTVSPLSGAGKVSTGLVPTADPTAVVIKQRSDAAGYSNRFDNARFYTSRNITVKGVPSGGSARFVDPWNRVVVSKAQPADSTADVVIDASACSFIYDGHWKLEVLDSGGVVLGTLDPLGGIFGGDVYEYNAAGFSGGGEFEPASRTLEKAWAFSHDGHVFYVLEMEGFGTIVHDLTTGQWHTWSTGAQSYWNMFRGIVWKGRTIAADHDYGKIWELDPATALDDGATEISRVVTGFQALRGDHSARQGSLRLNARQQGTLAADATVQMRFSDDGGKTWSAYQTVTLAAGQKRIEFRSLGRLRAPGRIWEFNDTGGLVRIDGVDSDMEEPNPTR